MWWPSTSRRPPPSNRPDDAVTPDRRTGIGGGEKPPPMRHDMLSLNNVEVIYDGVILVLKGASLEVRDAGITTLLGANRAVKTTTLNAGPGRPRTARRAVP